MQSWKNNKALAGFILCMGVIGGVIVILLTVLACMAIWKLTTGG